MRSCLLTNVINRQFQSTTRCLATFALAFSLALTTPFLFAQEDSSEPEPLYEVEIILFANHQQSDAEEDWPHRIEFPSFNNSRELLSPFEYLLARDELKENEYWVEPIEASPDSLDSIAARLTKNDNFELILHKRWRQPLQADRSTQPVFITDTGKDYLYQPLDSAIASQQDEANKQELSAEQQLLQDLLAEEKLLNQPVQEQPDFISDRDPIEPFELLELPESSKIIIDRAAGPPQHKVFGLVEVFKSRFPHLRFNLFYREKEIAPTLEEKTDAEMFPMAKRVGENLEPTGENSELVDQSNEEVDILGQQKPPLPAYQLQDSTRIRLNELHYFDHPKFGIISRVTRYEPPKPEEEQSN